MRNLLTAFVTAAFGFCIMSGASHAQDVLDWDSAFTRVEGGAIYDQRTGIDGAPVSEMFALTRVICTDGSRELRVMLPVSPGDDLTIRVSGGPASTMTKFRGSYRVTFVAAGKTIRKTLAVKPVNDPKSLNQRQFVVRLEYGDAIWTALTSSKSEDAIMLIGEGGLPQKIPGDPKLDAALKSCGLPV